MRFKIERTQIKLGEEIDLPDFSFNHAFIFESGNIYLYYLKAIDKDDYIKSQIMEIAAHLLGLYK